MGRQRTGGYIERERADDFLENRFCSVAAGVAVAGVAGAAMSANAAGDAADQQSASAREASQAQMMAAAQQRQDLAPWTSAGGAAQSRLNQYLGIGGVGSGGVTSLGLGTGLTPDQVRQQLLSRYSRPTVAANTAPAYRNLEEATQALGPMGAFQWMQEQTAAQQNGPKSSNGDVFREGEGPGYWEQRPGGQVGDRQWVSTGLQQNPGNTVDEEGLNAAIAKYYEEQNAQNAQAQSDPTYGSLLRPFHNGEEFDAGPAFSFTGEDLKTDPGYQFGLNQGTQGIERGQASRGNFLSGAAMKELDRYNQDYAGTKFNEGFNRASSTYNTNLSARQNEWNTNLNAYDNNRSRVYSFLTGVSGLGQASAAGVASGNQQAANNISQNALAAGNAQAAGTIGSSNALQSGLNSAVNGINSAGGWNSLLARGTSAYSPGGAASSGFGSGAAFGNQDLGMNF